jgi:hypothetical protein
VLAGNKEAQTEKHFWTESEKLCFGQNLRELLFPQGPDEELLMEISIDYYKTSFVCM